MTSKGVTRIFGNIGFLPLLIFLTAAGSAYACPEHKNRAANRTKAINTRTVSYMTPVVITYGGRCADSVSGTRRVKHVSMMGDGYFEGGARYVAVRNKAPRTRYVAVRDIDYDDVPRYVSVRRQVVYVEPAPRYAVVRKVAPRTRQVIVRDIDDDDTPRYIAVSRQPAYVEPVAVRNVVPRATYAAASDIDFTDDDASVVSSIDTDLEAEAARPKHVVVKTDDLTGTEEVIHSSPGDYDTSGIAPPIENVVTSDAIYTPAAFTNGNGIPDDIDVDDEAELSDSDVANIAADDMEDTSLPNAIVDTSPELVTTRAVSYASVDDIVNEAHSKGTDVTHVFDDDGHSIRYRPFAGDEDVVGTYVVSDDVNESAGTVSYVPVSDVDDVDAADITDLQAESASYVPIDDRDVATVMYVSNDSVDNVELMEIDADACPMIVSTLDGEPVQLVDSSAILADDDAIAGLNNQYEDIATMGDEDTLIETDNDLLPGLYLEDDSDEIEPIVE